MPVLSHSRYVAGSVCLLLFLMTETVGNYSAFPARLKTEADAVCVGMVIRDSQEMNVLLESIMSRWSCEPTRALRCLWVPCVWERPPHLSYRELWDLGPAGRSSLGPAEHRRVRRWPQQGKQPQAVLFYNIHSHEAETNLKCRYTTFLAL